MKGMKAYGKYGALGLELLLSIGVGYYLGAWLDKKAGTHFLAFVGFLLGCYAGFRALFRAAKQMQRDIENDEALERGHDPWAARVPDDRDDDAYDSTRRDADDSARRDADDSARRDADDSARRDARDKARDDGVAGGGKGDA